MPSSSIHIYRRHDVNIILGQENVDAIRDRYIILELDTFRIKGQPPVTAYCLIENPPINELLTLGSWVELHNNFIKNYKKRDWKFCLQALEHLKDKWNGDLKSFYEEIESRINDYEKNEPDPSWDGSIDRG